MEFFAVVIFAMIGIFWWNKKYRSKRLTQSYDWYIAQHPLVDGKVMCWKCKSNRILVNRGQDRTFVRTHFCAQCGEHLYYSDER